LASLQQCEGFATRVVICVTTFQRPEMLRQLLVGISQLRFGKIPCPDIRVVVVDNDSAASAGQISNSAVLPWPIQYVTECRRGISYARNRAIREAVDADFIAFLDDDECPTPDWLDELLSTQARFHADVVCGSVRPNFLSEVRAWAKDGGFFDRKIVESGQPLETCTTGNVLISTNVFSVVPGFDERFALTGAEDTHFFLRVRRAGFNMVSSAEAIAYEDVSASRANLPWILRRAYSTGNGWARCEAAVDRRTSTRIIRVGKGIVRITQGALSIFLFPFFGMGALAKALRSVCLGAGMLTASVGWEFQAYGRSEQSQADEHFARPVVLQSQSSQSK
jgi:succinoglycan biosynthesis protein ExoM